MYKIYAYGIEKVLVELILLWMMIKSYRESGEDTGLTDTAVSNKKNLEVVITIYLATKVTIRYCSLEVIDFSFAIL